MATLKELSEIYPNEGKDFMPYELGYGQNDDLSSISVCVGNGVDTVSIVLDYQIVLDWHLIRETSDREDKSPLSDDGYSLNEDWQDKYWESEDAWREWFRVVGNIISERYQGEYLDMAGSVLSFTEVREAPANLTEEELPGWIWENTSVVRLINETDPGTFNSPYLFTIIRNALNGAPYSLEEV